MNSGSWVSKRAGCEKLKVGVPVRGDMTTASWHGVYSINSRQATGDRHWNRRSRMSSSSVYKGLTMFEGKNDSDVAVKSVSFIEVNFIQACWFKLIQHLYEFLYNAIALPCVTRPEC
jgi:hypothetical protein